LPENKPLLEDLKKELDTDRLSEKVLRMKLGVMTLFKNEIRMKKAKKQRTESNKIHQDAVLDMTTQVPKKQSGVPVVEVSKSKHEEAEAGFQSVFK